MVRVPVSNKQRRRKFIAIWHKANQANKATSKKKNTKQHQKKYIVIQNNIIGTVGVSWTLHTGATLRGWPSSRQTSTSDLVSLGIVEAFASPSALLRLAGATALASVFGAFDLQRGAEGERQLLVALPRGDQAAFDLRGGFLAHARLLVDAVLAAVGSLTLLPLAKQASLAGPAVTSARHRCTLAIGNTVIPSRGLHTGHGRFHDITAGIGHRTSAIDARDCLFADVVARVASDSDRFNIGQARTNRLFLTRAVFFAGQLLASSSIGFGLIAGRTRAAVLSRIGATGNDGLAFAKVGDRERRVFDHRAGVGIALELDALLVLVARTAFGRAARGLGEAVHLVTIVPFDASIISSDRGARVTTTTTRTRLVLLAGDSIGIGLLGSQTSLFRHDLALDFLLAGRLRDRDHSARAILHRVRGALLQHGTHVGQFGAIARFLRARQLASGGLADTLLFLFRSSFVALFLVGGLETLDGSAGAASQVTCTTTTRRARWLFALDKILGAIACLCLFLAFLFFHTLGLRTVFRRPRSLGDQTLGQGVGLVASLLQARDRSARRSLAFNFSAGSILALNHVFFGQAGKSLHLRHTGLSMHINALRIKGLRSVSRLNVSRSQRGQSHRSQHKQLAKLHRRYSLSLDNEIMIERIQPQVRLSS